MSDKLIDVESPRLVPAAVVLGSVLDRIGPSLDARGDLEGVVSVLSFILREGTGAHRQRTARQGELTTEGLRRVVDRVATATAATAV